MKPDPAAQCRFFSAEDACRFALAAYYAASREIEPPPGEPWITEGAPWASGGDFADAFLEGVRDRVAAAAWSQSLRRSGSVIDGLWWPNPDEDCSDLTEHAALLLGRIMIHLPPEDNRRHNRLVPGVENGSSA
jgi:hypothetical protein